jgi:rSAM/selenodomain-associated transferase 2
MKLSIIIPAYNEEVNIGKVVAYLRQHSGGLVADLIVSDGGSADNTVIEAEKAGARAVLSPVRGRSAQMNYAASLATGDTLYFVHADTLPPKHFAADIQRAIDRGYDLGRYRTSFDSSKLLLKINAWFTRFDLFICMGGDQTLFVRRSLFDSLHGFREEMRIMEEYEFCERARRSAKYAIMRGAALISARKYDTNSWLRVQLTNSKIVRMYRKGASQQEMLDTYRQLLSYRKNAF